jgi:hypothetical protein
MVSAIITPFQPGRPTASNPKSLQYVIAMDEPLCAETNLCVGTLHVISTLLCKVLGYAQPLERRPCPVGPDAGQALMTARLPMSFQRIAYEALEVCNGVELAALEAAMVLKPEIIFLLSADITGAGDYEISEKTLMEALDRMNPRDPATHNRPVRIQCVQFLDPDPSGTLERLAREHGGADGYRYLGRKELGLDNNQE